jgi:hypothetical protein
MPVFEAGRAKTGGRAKGARNKISAAFLEALAADFEQHGEAAIKLMRLEKPAEYVKVSRPYCQKNLKSPKTD